MAKELTESRKISKLKGWVRCIKSFLEDVEEDKDLVGGYFEGIDLKGISEKISQDLENWQEEIRKNYTWLKPGEVVKISGGDGISYHQDDYLEILAVSDTKVKVNQITAVFGEYGNELKADLEKPFDKEELLGWFERNYHDSDTSANRPKFEQYKKLVNAIPEL